MAKKPHGGINYSVVTKNEKRVELLNPRGHGPLPIGNGIKNYSAGGQCDCGKTVTGGTFKVFCCLAYISNVVIVRPYHIVARVFADRKMETYVFQNAFGVGLKRNY